jgi:hypothetical protein
VLHAQPISASKIKINYTVILLKCFVYLLYFEGVDKLQVFENSSRKILAPRGMKYLGHLEYYIRRDFMTYTCPPSVVRVVRYRRRRWAGNVDRMGNKNHIYSRMLEGCQLEDRGWNWLRIVSSGGLYY